MKRLAFFKRVPEHTDRQLERQAPSIISRMLLNQPMEHPSAVLGQQQQQSPLGLQAHGIPFQAPQAFDSATTARPPSAAASSLPRAGSATQQKELLQHPSILRRTLRSFLKLTTLEHAAAVYVHKLSELSTVLTRLGTMKQRLQATAAAQRILQLVPSSSSASSTATGGPSIDSTKELSSGPGRPVNGHLHATSVAAPSRPSAAAALSPPAPAPSLGFTPYQSSLALSPAARLEAQAAERSRIREAHSSMQAERIGRSKAKRRPSSANNSHNHSQQQQATATRAVGATADGTNSSNSNAMGRRIWVHRKVVTDGVVSRSRPPQVDADRFKRGTVIVFGRQPPLSTAATSAAPISGAAASSASRGPSLMSQLVNLVSGNERSARAVSSIHGSGLSATQQVQPALGRHHNHHHAPSSSFAPHHHAAASAASAASAVNAHAHDIGAFYPASSLRSAGIHVLHDNMYTMLGSILRTEGAWALTRGLLPRMVVNGPASAATFVIYEQVLRLSRKSPEEMSREEQEQGGKAGGEAAASMLAIASNSK